jgi:hypothetical protein
MPVYPDAFQKHGYPSAQPTCLIGDSGTGKSHLLIGLGTAAAENGYRVKCTTAAALVNCSRSLKMGLSQERCFRRGLLVGLGGRPAVTERDGEGVDHCVPSPVSRPRLTESGPLAALSH